jgi:hypothetical protein
MLDTRRCIRCFCDLDLLEDYKDAEHYEDELNAEGITVDVGDALCDGCAEEVKTCQ